MAVQNVSGLSAVIRDVADPTLLDSVFKNFHFLRLFRSIGPKADDTYKLKVITASNSSPTVTADTGAYPGAQATTYASAEFAWVTVYTTYGITDESKRSIGPDLETSLVDGFGDEADALGQNRDLFETTFMADAATGLLGLVDDDSTAWGGINRGVSTTLQSLVVAGGSAALTHAMLTQGDLTVRNAPYGGKPELLLSSVTQKRRYIEALLDGPQSQVGGKGDASYDFDLVGYGGKPWVAIPDFVESEIVFASGVFDGSGMYFVDHNYWDTAAWKDADAVEFQQMQVGPNCKATLSHVTLGKTAPITTKVWGLSGAFVVRQPWKQSKIEALATSW